MPFLYIGNKTIYYDITYKKVKNINLRVNSDGRVSVSANKRVSEKVINDFVSSKADFILRALESYEQKKIKPQIQYFTEEELKTLVLETCQKVYPYYEVRGIKYPQIKFRKMVSRWGSCHSVKGIVTFNTNLMYTPRECVEYVVWHEFTHFLQPNHSKMFYYELEKVCPDWKRCRMLLRETTIR